MRPQSERVAVGIAQIYDIDRRHAIDDENQRLSPKVPGGPDILTLLGARFIFGLLISSLVKGRVGPVNRGILPQA